MHQHFFVQLVAVDEGVPQQYLAYHCLFNPIMDGLFLVLNFKCKYTPIALCDADFDRFYYNADLRLLVK